MFAGRAVQEMLKLKTAGEVLVASLALDGAKQLGRSDLPDTSERL